MIAAIAVGLVLIAVGLYGLAASRNMVRLLIAIEVVVVGALAALAPVLSAAPSVGLWALVLLISMAAGEVAIIGAVIYRAYATAKTTDLEEFRSGRDRP
ncbi:NADH-quinone oxidoreductase, subunit K [Thermoproteus uzoniensis 768-20]|uniref:NADH-quinone oxidoreductase, subunit K n=1 Tax=Thermoproteus uzoniensis (strain 768-20) TaxID=999630 RepID=F2L5T5_THEU7|nr:NADH-quinone oxidoreductase subunit K [Thermoproteus uzoniensis]AEA13631.1 NADH-quinone oxidoreductase, subunit K [Thermoproteus uzoniensis 768-20]